MTAPDLTDVFAYIDARRGEHLARLVEYLRLPSISAQGLAMDETAAYARDLLARAGLEARVVATAGAPMVLGSRADRVGGRTLLVYGHYDVQPPDPLESWVSPPFEPTVRDGRLYARGVGDNKGQHLAHILAIEALVACRGRLPCNVKFLLEGEEEVGSPRMPAFVATHRDALAADLCVISDGTVDDSGRAALRFGVRGVLSFELRAAGAAHDLHSGHWGDVAPNPIWTLIHLLSSMKDEHGQVTIDGFYDQVAPVTALERGALDRLDADLDLPGLLKELGLPALAPPSGRGVAERRAAWPAFTVNGIHGGYGGPGSKTVLPHQAFAKCDIRLVESQTADQIFDLLATHVRRHAPNVELVRQGSMDPSKTPLDHPLAAPIRSAIAAVEGEEPLMHPAMGGSLPEYAFTKTLGIPCFGVPFANADEANHAPNENMEVERFHRGIKTAAAILAHLGEE